MNPEGDGIDLVVPTESCYLCGTHGDVLYAQLRDYLYDAPGVWSIRACGNTACRLLWLDPQPTAKMIPRLYTNYFTHRSDSEATEVVAYRRPLLAWAHGPLRELNRLFGFVSFESFRVERRLGLYLGAPPRPGARLLDVGCGAGDLLSLMRRKGWDVEGQDIDAEATTNAVRKHDLKIHAVPLEDIPVEPGSFDAITMNHVIEHVIDPRRTLERCHALLRPGGILALATVNRDSWCHARFREHWRGLEIPRHLWVFTCGSMNAVISGAGFGATKVWDTADGTTFFYHESQLIQDRALRGGQDEQARFRSHVSRALFGRLRPLTSVVQRGQGEELFAHARKPGTDRRP